MAKFRVELQPSAEEDLKFFPVNEQRVIVQAVLTLLTEEPDVPTKRRKQLRPNVLAPWELKVGDFRVFCEIDTPGSLVRVLAVGHKHHNELFMRGKKVEL